MKKKLFFPIAVALAIMVSSCQKAENVADIDVNLADDDAVTEAVFDDVFSSVDIASIGLEDILGADTKGPIFAGDTCPIVTVNDHDPLTWPKVVTIDYGAGCVYGELVRKGKIMITVSAPRNETGSTRTVTFDEYFFNDIKVEGTKIIENLGFNTNQNLVVSVTLAGGKLTLPDGKTIEREVAREREWIAGMNTPRNVWDDVCLITGTTSGVTIKGVAYSTTIAAPLKWVRACRFLVSGIIRIERAGAEAVELDFGDGTCDARAVLRKGDQEKEIILKVRHRLMK